MVSLKKDGAKSKMRIEYSFYNIPKKYSLQDYKETVNFIIKKYSKVKGLMSAYNWGGTFTPGISDLDIIFVFNKSKASAMPFFKRVFYILNDKHRYIARHPFFYIDSESFENIRYIYPDAEFKLLHGKNIKIKKVSSRDAYFPRTALMTDVIARHYPRDFLEQAIVKSINVRDMLLRLNSLKYSIKTMELITKEKNKEWNDKLKQIEHLRKNWFNKNNFALLASLNEDAIRMGIDMAENFRDFLVKNNLVNISGEKVEYNGARNKTLFIKDWEKEKALSDMSKLIRNKQKYWSILPIEFAPQQIEYSKHNGLISSYVKNNLKNNLKYQIKYADIIKKRASILNKQAELASMLKHSDFVAFFDFGYRNKSGINNTILNFIRSFRD